MADLYKGHDATDQGQHGCPYHLHRSVRLCRPDVASDCQHGPEHDDLVCRPFYPERAVHHQLSGADGRLHVLAMVPMVILYLVFQKQFIEGIAMTGGK